MHSDIEEFVRFLDNYKDNYRASITELSKHHPINERRCRFENNESGYYVDDFEMLDFDLMCCESFKSNRPSTFDALYYEIQDDILYFYLIEFKDSCMDISHTKQTNLVEKNISNLYNFYDSYEWDDDELDEIDRLYDNALHKFKNYSYHSKNSVEFSLRIKAFESLYVTLPALYHEFYLKHPNPNRNELNIFNFLTSELCIIEMYTAGKKGFECRRSEYDKNESNHRKLYSKVELQYNRLRYLYPNIIDYGEVLSKEMFKELLINIKSNEENCQKTLNISNL